MRPRRAAAIATAIATAVVGVVVVLGWTAFRTIDRSDGQAPALAGAPVDDTAIVRGEYLAKAADCIACHTAPGGGKPFAGGVAFKLPFGTIYSSNITADPATGIGRWTDEQFVRALREGIRSDGQQLYPAFPYTSYIQLSRSDVLAIKAYLFSRPIVSQASTPSSLSFPFNQRWAMAFWNAAFLKSERFTPTPERSPQWNAGAYLFGALGHCAECHTPRNVAFALQHRNELAGESLQGWKAPNITSDTRHGVGAWSDRELADYLSTGHAAGHGSAGGPMGEVIANSLQFLRAKDIDALVVYLRGVPARAMGPLVTASAVHPAGPDVQDASQQGLKLFDSACASCHLWNGEGRQTSLAALAGARATGDIEGANVTQMILHGAQMKVNGAEVSMPAFGDAYSDTEVAALANHVIARFGNRTGVVTPAMVAKQRRP